MQERKLLIRIWLYVYINRRDYGNHGDFSSIYGNNVLVLSPILHKYTCIVLSKFFHSLLLHYSLLPITSKNRLPKFSEEVISKIGNLLSKIADFWRPLLDSNQRPAD